MSAEQSSRPPVEPVLIGSFEGWNDAAESATGVIDHLLAVWDAELVVEIDPEDYYDFQVNRPYVGLDETGIREITWPTTRIYVARPAGADRDIVLVRGIEPNMRWRQFCSELVDMAGTLHVGLVVTLGALLADTPHTRPIPVTGTSADAQVAARLELQPSRYEGPTGINGVFLDVCARADLPCVSIWAAVPHYVAQPPCPKATLALLSRLEDLLEVSIPFGDLPEEARAWQRGVDELAQEDTEIREYVESLEEAQDTSELPEATGEAIAREFERYLKRRHHDPD